MDQALGGEDYQSVCYKLLSWIDDPEQTISGRLLADTKRLGGIGKLGCELGKEYSQHHLKHSFKVYSAAEMETEATRSMKAQQELEAAEAPSFDEFLADYFSYLEQS